jgi:putative transposase
MIEKNKQIVFIDRWYPSSKTCSSCGYVLEGLDLSVREWRCPSCQIVGASTIGLGGVSRATPAIAVSSPESPLL